MIIEDLIYDDLGYNVYGLNIRKKMLFQIDLLLDYFEIEFLIDLKEDYVSSFF